jgi:hypothetical protein
VLGFANSEFSGEEELSLSISGQARKKSLPAQWFHNVWKPDWLELL